MKSKLLQPKLVAVEIYVTLKPDEADRVRRALDEGLELSGADLGEDGLTRIARLRFERGETR